MKQFDYLCAPYVPIDAQSEHSQPINEDCSNENEFDALDADDEDDFLS